MTAGATPESSGLTDYPAVHADIVAVLEAARRAAARSVNAVMTACYWEIGRRIVEFEQGGKGRAEYGTALPRTCPFASGAGSAWTPWNPCACSTRPIRRRGFPNH